MNFQKKVLVLKQVIDGFSVSDKAVGGIARFERDSGITTFHLSLINLSAIECGGYFAAISFPSRPLQIFDLGVRPLTFNRVLESETSISSPTVALVFIKDDIPSVIAYASDDKTSITDFKKSLAEKCLTDRQKKISLKKEPTREPSPKYDDEALATENYFEKDKNFNQKISIAQKVNDERISNADACATSASQEKTRTDATRENFLQDEKLDDYRQDYTAQSTFFSAKRKEINELFESCESEPTLAKVIPDSRWVKVYYDKNKHYVVGVVKEKGKEKYICYGVPSKYSAYPPSELASYCSFIPLSIFDLKGDGYWMMFQSAENGECVKFNQKF